MSGHGFHVHGPHDEALDPGSPFFEGKTGVGSQERLQPDGRPITCCRLDDDKKNLACPFPGSGPALR